MRRFTIPLLACLLAACAGPNYRPMIDTKGADMRNYEVDLADCQNYARQTYGAPENAAAGAIAGAALGAVLAAVGGGSYGKGAGARVGGVLGGVSGAAHGDSSQRDVIRNCMMGRGYRVLQ